MESSNSEQQKRDIEETGDTQATSSTAQSIPEGTTEKQAVLPAQEQRLADDARDVTLYRDPAFNVHAFASPASIKAQAGTRGSSFLERIGWPSAERKRLIEEETHPLPQVELARTASQRNALPRWLEGVGVALFLGATLVLQALSLFTYPAYTNDEGNYMANAWAVLQGRISAYTFTYNHPPLGWVQIAAWTKLTGGIASFGNAINSGRVLMLVLATASSLLLYLITRRLSGSRSAGLLAMVIYTLSPLSLLYRHEILLENIGTFWLLLSLCLITNGKSRLGTIVLAALALGIAILSKGVFLIFLPVMFYAVLLHTTRFQRKFLLVAFIYISLALASLYVLFALLKGELLPASTSSGGVALHTNLLDTLLQTFQSPGPQAPFRDSWHTWMRTDMILLIGGGLAMGINILGGTLNRFQLLAALFAASSCLFLLTSSTVYAFAILPLLPFLALNIALALNNTLHWLTRGRSFDFVRVLLILVVLVIIVPMGIQSVWSSGSASQTEAQQEALWWTQDHVAHNAVVITNSYLYADLHESQEGGAFPHAQIYSNAALDPAIAAGELKQDWQKVDFLVVDSSMLQNIFHDKRYFFLDQALHHAVLQVAYGSSANGTLIEIYQVVHGT